MTTLARLRALNARLEPGPMTGHRSFTLAALIICGELLFIFLVRSGVNAHQGSGALEDLMALNPEYAKKPFATRVLVPQVVRALSGPLLPWKSAIDQAAWNVPILSTVLQRFEARRSYYVGEELRTFDHTTEALVCWVVLYAFFVGFVAALRRLIFDVRGDDDCRVLALASAPALVPFMAFGHVWDPATLFFWATLLCLMVEEQWRMYCLVFALACFNRETTLLLAVIFAAGFYGRMPRGRFVGVLAFQIFAAVAIKVALEAILAAHGIGGDSAEWRAGQHLPGGWLVPVDQRVLLVALAFAALAAARSRISRILLGQPMATAALFVAYLLFGQPGEIRVFYELVPLGLLALVPGQRPACSQDA